ncbi:uncharacterized protein K452DRAFT_286743 [Aplosporella prunicola CBS 121167]|uniref:AB hydrolase-1 domain-containing protein n=1 Tax=Aplosporella prunicola CBS 121167 TaxID=1176127 RepID=A0A6A6BFI1_9PEZI|nr:uncharacterized protein K452DRAFT_286743 [Aplosporella prunicola CBS 121167]KAF2142318.1 hypothetical protein K452DRAFT_286743 [Aplosporella prunicola CBS 121167]
MATPQPQPQPPTPTQTHIPTTIYGTLSITHTTPPSPPSEKPSPALLLLHGNSSSSQIFTHFFTHPTAQHHRIMALDLPGHGSSSDAPAGTVEKAYTQAGYAAAALEVLAQLGVASVIVFGNSLGGHVAIEMVAQTTQTPQQRPPLRIHGILLTGTPPANGLAQVRSAFHDRDPHAKVPPQHMHLASQASWPDTAYATFPYEAYGPPNMPWMLSAARRTDPLARSTMYSAFEAGAGADQVAVIGRTDVLVGVVNGAQEPFVRLEYLDGLRWGRLWQGRCLRLEGLGHAPFWERPGLWAGVWGEFVWDCCAEL